MRVFRGISLQNIGTQPLGYFKSPKTPKRRSSVISPGHTYTSRSARTMAARFVFQRTVNKCDYWGEMSFGVIYHQ